MYSLVSPVSELWTISKLLSLLHALGSSSLISKRSLPRWNSEGVFSLEAASSLVAAKNSCELFGALSGCPVLVEPWIGSLINEHLAMLHVLPMNH